MSDQLQDLPEPLVPAARLTPPWTRFRSPRLIPEKAVFRPALALRSLPGSNGTNMTDRIGPIETEYAGHRFRSRLEARWAVVFDAMGMAWKYESQGFEGGGERYLPDFFLPTFNLWVEVKGERRTLLEQRHRLMRVLMSGALPHFLDSSQEFEIRPNGGLLLLGDIPMPDDQAAPCFPLIQHHRMHRLCRHWAMFIGRKDSDEWSIGLERGDGFVAQLGGLAMRIGLESALPHLGTEDWVLGPVACTMLRGLRQPADAFRAGRQARFEHGQSGAN